MTKNENIEELFAISKQLFLGGREIVQEGGEILPKASQNFR